MLLFNAWNILIGATAWLLGAIGLTFIVVSIAVNLCYHTNKIINKERQ